MRHPYAGMLGSGRVDDFELASEWQLGLVAPQPSLAQLAAHLRRFGPDCVVESAQHLPEEQRKRLAVMVKRAPALHRPKIRRGRVPGSRRRRS